MSLWEVCGAETECPQTVLSLTVGIFLGAVAYGGLVTTGINCIRLLAPTSGNNVLQTQLLRWYISVLLIINTIFQVGNFLWTNFFPVFGRRIPDPVVQEQAFNTLELLRTLSVLLTAASTDGLLVWRCYLVQNTLVFTRSAVLRRAFWIFPSCLWMMMLVLGVAGDVIKKTVPIGQEPLADLVKPFLITAMTAHVTLNLFATLFIISALIQYRRMIKSSFGTPVRGYPDRLIEMIIESSAPSVPLTIIIIVGVMTKNFYGDILLSIVVPTQSLASVLLPYRIALGKAIGAESNKE